MIGKHVYIAGPLTKGDSIKNLKRAVEFAGRLAAAGHVPYCPHLSWFMELSTPLGWDEWMRIDLAWLSKCACVVRLPGESRGADVEVAHAISLEMPVYTEDDFWKQYPCTPTGV